MEAVRVNDGILFKPKQVVDRNEVADRIASMLASTPVQTQHSECSEEEVMEDIVTEIAASRRERRHPKA